MIFVKDNNIGEFPGISVQLFDFENPVAKIAMESCHCLPHSWGAYHMPNQAGTKTMVFHLEASPLFDESDEDAEEYRPYQGNVWVFHGSSDQMWDLVKNKPDSFINCLVYHKLDQDKLFADNIRDLREQEYY